MVQTGRILVVVVHEAVARDRYHMDRFSFVCHVASHGLCGSFGFADECRRGWMHNTALKSESTEVIN